jgi:site-specific DNA-methyltransferase (adenine-specific)
LNKRSNIKIISGDALVLLPTLASDSVDAVITDPPYSSGGQSAVSRKQNPEKKYQNTGVKRRYPQLLGDSRDQRGMLAWASLWLAECWRIAKPGSPLLIFSDWRQLPLFSDAIQSGGWTWRGTIVWDKTEAARPQQGAFRSQAEYVLFASKGRWKPLVKDCLPGVLRQMVVPKEKNHINAKPVPLIENLLRILPTEATVLDPFAGGGSTAKACANTGRDCIGIELNPEMAEAARLFVGLDIAASSRREIKEKM